MKPLAFLFVSIFISIILLWGPSCANIIPPSGGPRDSLPPTLIRVTPGDSTTNFTGNRVEFQFDEYVDLQDLQNNVLFTPTFERNPEIAVKGRNITVRFLDSLEPNTTYILNFGDAVRDINEMNILRGFRYTFSTGPALDSLEIYGRVVLAQTGKIDSTLTIILHRDLRDSAVINSRPIYVTRVDANGNFRFRNLPEGRFAVYALGDAGMGRRYLNRNQLFAFLDSTVVAGQQDTALTLYAYRETTPATQGTGTMRPPTGVNRLTFFTNLANQQQDLMKDLTLSFPVPVKNLDTTKLRLTVDSSFSPVQQRIELDSNATLLTIKTPWLEGRPYNLILDRDFAEDTLGRKLLKTDTLFFSTKKSSEYAGLNIRFRNLDTASNPVLLFVQNELLVHTARIINGSVSIPRFIPGEYELRLLYDRNNNGIWDTGRFFVEKRQPELIRSLDRRINVRVNFENEIDIIL